MVIEIYFNICMCADYCIVQMSRKLLNLDLEQQNEDPYYVGFLGDEVGTTARQSRKRRALAHAPHDVGATSSAPELAHDAGSIEGFPSIMARTYLCPCRFCACTTGMPPYLTLGELEDHLANHGMAPAQMVCGHTT